MSADSDAPVERILVIAVDRLGDTLQSCGALHVLRQRFPAARIDLLALENYASALLGSPFHDRYLGLTPDDVVSYGRAADAALAGENVAHDGLAELAGVLHGERYDLIVNLVTSTLGAWLSTVASPRFSVGLYVGADRSLLVAGQSLRYFVALLDFRDENPFNLVDLFRASVLAPQSTTTPEMHVATAPCSLEGGPSMVALNPGASQADRRWPLSSFAALADALASESITVVLVGGPADVALCEAVRQASKSKPAVHTNLSVPEMAGWFRTLGCVVANETGALHIAAAAGAKSVGFYGGFSRYRETAPFGNGHLLLEGAELADVGVEAAKEAVLVQLGRRSEADAIAVWRSAGVEVARTRIEDDRIDAMGGVRYTVLVDRHGDGDEPIMNRMVQKLAECTYEKAWAGTTAGADELAASLVSFTRHDLRTELGDAHRRWSANLEKTADRWLALASEEVVHNGQVGTLLKVEAMHVQEILGAGTALLSKLLEWDLKMIPFAHLETFAADHATELRATALLSRRWADAFGPASAEPAESP